MIVNGSEAIREINWNNGSLLVTYSHGFKQYEYRCNEDTWHELERQAVIGSGLGELLNSFIKINKVQKI
ncbi:MAG: hypothetical protein LBL60_03595 [Mycoplasmataceae bacterium]|jgi:hypothetical protein|nr:hypothetical protein [Mycoplasmataceae bacterium]